jgi:hypothetical protein
MTSGRAMRAPGKRRATVTVAVDWKKVLLVALVVLLVLIGLPMLMPGMGGGATCDDCGQAVVLPSPLCLIAVLLAGAALTVHMLSRRVRASHHSLNGLLLVLGLDRPPQLA